MGLNVKKVGQSGGFFSADKLTGYSAILIEVKRFAEQVPGGEYDPKDTIYADVTTFESAEDLREGKPTSISKNQSIQSTVLVRQLHEDVGIGNATIVTVSKKKGKKGGAGYWAFDECAGSIQELVIAYADERDAVRDAALADMPDFG